MKEIKTWEDEDGRVYVSGTHDTVTAYLAILDGISMGNISRPDDKDDPDWTFGHPRFGVIQQARREWVHRSVIDEEEWPANRVYKKRGFRRVPFLFIF